MAATAVVAAAVASLTAPLLPFSSSTLQILARKIPSPLSAASPLLFIRRTNSLNQRCFGTRAEADEGSDNGAVVERHNFDSTCSRSAQGVEGSVLRASRRTMVPLLLFASFR
ncbi:hypothetical protein MA16_Dca021848 [Dendrobium catenatum]|uniref:Uncharacterized protein n=1 Tax=Dendrobium catenatum TaxID=906689 RepID=A0A2I0X6C5_9ASPA|nr:hypothetical protein MA16_Dca021848 [Dendrobium catenatum]